MGVLKGIPASAGVATGKAFIFRREHIGVPHLEVGREFASAEVARFSEAVEAVRKNLQGMGRIKMNSEERSILEMHLAMLDDPEFHRDVESVIMEKHINAEWAISQVLNRHAEVLSRASDDLLRERMIDFIDLAHQLIVVLTGHDEISLSKLSDDVILVSNTLLPIEILSLDKRHVKGIALDGGGRTSHASILARSFEIPTVVGLKTITDMTEDGDDICIDGTIGEVAVNPTQEMAEAMQQRYSRWMEHEAELKRLSLLPAVTIDGHRIALKANVETLEEVELLSGGRDDGIGLYRSEFLFIRSGGFAGEEEQYQEYKSVLESAGEESVTIRTIDLGGEKIIPGLALDEDNPILGWRAIRFSLARKDIFAIQLRALLRASVHGKLRIMFPMISGVEELREVLEILNGVKASLRDDAVPFNENIEIGSMIEVPSAALCAEDLAQMIDFLSIGTNDLIQYTLAVDRGNEKIAYLYQPFHPGVLKLISTIIAGGHAAGIPVGMCGEMAGDPQSTALLVGMGIDELSMSPQGMAEVKQVIRTIAFSDAKKLANDVLSMHSYEDISAYIQEWMHDRCNNNSTV